MNKYFEISVLPNQTIWDVAIQYYGSVDGVFDILDDNPVLTGLNHSLTVGLKLMIKVDFYYRKEVVDYFKISKQSPATGGTVPEPIDPDPDPDPDPAFVFTDLDAKAYYDKLVIANSGDIDGAVYGITLDQFKGAIDTLFLSLKSSGSFNNIKNLYLFLGTNSATQAINAKTTLSDVNFIGTPVHNKYGVVLNGSTQYVECTNNPSLDLMPSSHHLMLYCAPTTVSFGMGSRNGTTQWLGLYQITANRVFSTMGASSSGKVTMSTESNMDKVHIGSRSSASSAEFYEDGILAGDVLGTQGTLPSNPSFIGAWSNSGSAINYLNGHVKSASIGLGLSLAQSTSYTTAIKTFNASINR